MDAAIAETSLDGPDGRRGGDSSPPSSRASTLDSWDVRERDVPRRLRLVAGALLPALGVALVGVFLPPLPQQAQRVVEEDAPIEALLVDAPEVPPPPEPEVPQPAAAAIAPAPGPRIQKVEAPKEVPTAAPEKDAPAEAAPEGAAAAPEGPAGGGGPPGSTGTGFAPAPPPPTPKPAARAPPKPAPVPEEITPPKAVSMKSPGYPSAAKSAGIEGTVVIAYTVGESGAVTDARVVKGPPELAQACLDAVRGWRFSPAMSGGRPVSVKRSARFPFRLKT